MASNENGGAAAEEGKVNVRKSLGGNNNLRASRGANNALAGGDDEKKNVGALLGFNKEELGVLDAEPPLVSKLVSECVGTFFLVFVVGVSTQSKNSALAPIGIGLILSIMIYTFGSVSGGMFNPAVTVAVLLSRRDKITPKNAGLYIAVQFLGATLAGIFAYLVTDKSFCFDWDVNPNGGSGTSLLLEAFYTAALCSCVLAAGTSYDVPNQYFGFAIGLTVTASAYTCSGYDQGSFNPAVTWGINFANAINSKGQEDCGAGEWLLFLFAPFLGSCMAAGKFRGTRDKEYKAVTDETIPALMREKLLAETVGTFFLVYTVGVAVTGGGGGLASLAIGTMLGVQIYTFGSVSGGMFNPAVALAVFLSGRGKITGKDAAAYIGTQFLSGLIAGFFAYITTDKTFFFDYELTRPAGGSGSSFLLEVLCTGALCMAVLSTGTSKDAPNHYFGFAIGLTVTASAITCGDFNQGSFNPAVTFGINMANYANDKTDDPEGGGFLLFLFAPFLGSMLATGIFMATRLKEYRNEEGKLMLFGNVDPQTVGKPGITATE